MRVAILAPLVWRTPPRQYGPWEQVASNIAEGLIAAGCEVTLFASGDSITKGKLESVSKMPYGEYPELDPKVWECLHIAKCMEQANDFDIINNHYDFLPLSYSKLINTPMVTTIHGFSSEKIIEVYERYNANNHYVSISDSDRSPRLNYRTTIYHGINEQLFDLNEVPVGWKGERYLLYFSRIHPEKGTADAIRIAKATKQKLIIAGLVQDQAYYEREVLPHVDGEQVVYVGNLGPSERNTILGNAMALLHPIYFAEPFGLSVAEAGFCGTPVIAYSRGSMPELIADGVNGFLVKNENEAAERVADIESIDRKSCRSFVAERFSIRKMVADYLALFETLATKLTHHRK